MNLEGLLDDIRGETTVLTQTINNILKEHTESLDELIKDIDTTLTKVRTRQIEEYPLEQLELDFTQLTIEIYKVNSVVAELGGTTDFAKSKKEIAFSKAYLKARGNTIKEKEALATIEIEKDIVIEKVYDRVIRQLKLITDNAENIHLALKRMHSARLTEMEVFRVGDLKGARR